MLIDLSVGNLRWRFDDPRLPLPQQPATDQSTLAMASMRLSHPAYCLAPWQPLSPPLHISPASPQPHPLVHPPFPSISQTEDRHVRNASLVDSPLDLARDSRRMSWAVELLELRGGDIRHRGRSGSCVFREWIWEMSRGIEEKRRSMGRRVAGAWIRL